MLDRDGPDDLRTVCDPPPGLLAYGMGESGGKMRVIGVWEAAAAPEAYCSGRVGPATRDGAS